MLIEEVFIMTYFFVFISGILFWQLVTFIAAIITHEDQDVILSLSLGLPLIVWNYLADKFYSIRLIYIKKRYVICTVYSDTDMCSGIAIPKKDIDRYYLEGENQNFIKVHDSEIRSIPCQFINRLKPDGFLTSEWVDKNLKK